MMIGIGMPISHSKMPFMVSFSSGQLPWCAGERGLTIAVPERWRLVDDDASYALAGVHQLEALVDLLELQHMGDHRVDCDLARHVPVDDLRHVGAALGAAEGGAAPVAARNELERAGGDLLASFRDAD